MAAMMRTGRNMKRHMRKKMSLLRRSPRKTLATRRRASLRALRMSLSPRARIMTRRVMVERVRRVGTRRGEPKMKKAEIRRRVRSLKGK